MPSGRGGSRTSSSRSRSGGSRTSSSRSSGARSSSPSRSSSSGHRSGGNRTTFVFFGGRGCGRRNAGSAVGVFAVIALVVALIGLFMMMGANTTMNNIKTEHEIYRNMITAAESNPALQRDAKVLRHNKNDKGDKWWFEYEIIPQGSDSMNINILLGNSLPIYSSISEMPIITVNIPADLIKVAVEHPTISSMTDSVPNAITRQDINKSRERR